MFKLRKRIFLFLTLIATVFCVVGCGNKNTVRIYFEKNEYEVRMQTHYELKPVVKASATVNTAELELVYESSNEEIARYVDGTIYPVSEGTVEVKVYWKDKASVYDKAVVKVIKAALPEFRADDPIVVLKGDKKVIPYELHLNYTNAVAKFYALDLSPEVATITEDGVLDPIALGEGTIKVVVSDYSGEEYETKVAIKVIESDFNITYEFPVLKRTDGPNEDKTYNINLALDESLKQDTIYNVNTYLNNDIPEYVVYTDSFMGTTGVKLNKTLDTLTPSYKILVFAFKICKSPIGKLLSIGSSSLPVIF